MWLNGVALTDTDADGNALSDDTFLVLFNASWNPQAFTLPSSGLGTTWMPVLTQLRPPDPRRLSSAALPADSACTLSPRSLLVLRRTQ